MIGRVLIANRGEIALRILRACRTLGIEAVVAYSEADRRSLPAMLADEAICIGPADAKRSYLSAPALISAALVTGCDAIHPGYGFLSEDDAFADAVRAHGLTFIGPPANVLERFASKEETRRLLADQGLPTIPGSGLLRRRGPRPRGGRADRLPGARQAVGRRRRQGHADGPLAARAGRGPADLPLRGARRVRRRLAVPRALARGQPPRRGPGRGRPVRPRRPPVGARLLGPAPAPEDPRGVAVAGDDRGGAAGARRARDPGRRRGRLRERRHARVPRRQRRQRLLHRDQLPDPGRAPGDRDADRHRPRRDADPDRGGRAAGVHPGGRRPARPRDRVPDQRRGSRAGLPPGRRHDRAVQRPRRPRRAVRLARLLGLRGAAVLRLAARQARGLGARPARARSRAAAPRSTSWSSTASSPTRRSTARCWCRSRSSTAGSRPTCSIASAAPRSSPGRCAREAAARRPADRPTPPRAALAPAALQRWAWSTAPAARDTLSDPAWSSM